MKGRDRHFSSGVVCLLRALALLALGSAAACQQAEDAVSVRPKTLRDVPAVRLAFRFEADVAAENLPEQLKGDGAPEKNEAVARDFETRRPEEELLRTVTSPDGQRALALYATSETSGLDFRMDLYSSEGVFLRNIMPPNMVGAFYEEVAWSADGQHFAFLGFRNPAASATPDPGRETTAPPQLPRPASPATRRLATAAPTPLTPVPPRRPTTARPPPSPPSARRHLSIATHPPPRATASSLDGLVADAQSSPLRLPRPMDARRAGAKRRAARRLFTSTEGALLDDSLADAAPAWSPDGAKVATDLERQWRIRRRGRGRARTSPAEALGVSSIRAKMLRRRRRKANRKPSGEEGDGGAS